MKKSQDNTSNYTENTTYTHAQLHFIESHEYREAIENCKREVEQFNEVHVFQVINEVLQECIKGNSKSANNLCTPLLEILNRASTRFDELAQRLRACELQLDWVGHWVTEFYLQKMKFVSLQYCIEHFDTLIDPAEIASLQSSLDNLSTDYLRICQTYHEVDEYLYQTDLATERLELLISSADFLSLCSDQCEISARCAYSISNLLSVSKSIELEQLSSHFMSLGSNLQEFRHLCQQHHDDLEKYISPDDSAAEEPSSKRLKGDEAENSPPSPL